MKIKLLFLASLLLVISCGRNGGSVCDKDHKGPRDGHKYRCDGVSHQGQRRGPGEGDSHRVPSQDASRTESTEIDGKWGLAGLVMEFTNGYGKTVIPPDRGSDEMIMTFSYLVDATSIPKKMRINVIEVSDGTVDGDPGFCIYEVLGAVLRLECDAVYPGDFSDEAIALNRL